MRHIIKILVYSLPFATIVGRNFNVGSIGGRNLALGPVELILVLLTPLFILKKDKKFPSLYIIVFIQLLIILFGYFFNDYTISVAAWIEALRWLEYFVLFIFVYNFLENINDFNNIFYVFFISSIIFIVFGYTQVFSFNYFEQRIYGTFVSSSNLEQESVANPNVAGSFLGIFVLYSYAFTFIIKNRILNIFITIIIILAFILLLNTLSRSAFIGLLTAMFIFDFQLRNSLKKYLTSLILFISLLYLLISSNYFSDNVIINRALNTFDSSTNDSKSVTDRIDNSSETLILARYAQPFGYGYGNFVVLFNLVPDNYFIETYAETGIFGLIIVIILLVFIYLKLYHINKKANDLLFVFVSASIAFYLSFILQNISGNLFRSPRLLSIFWLLIAITLKLPYLNKNEKQK